MLTCDVQHSRQLLRGFSDDLVEQILCRSAVPIKKVTSSFFLPFQVKISLIEEVFSLLVQCMQYVGEKLKCQFFFILICVLDDPRAHLFFHRAAAGIHGQEPALLPRAQKRHHPQGRRRKCMWQMHVNARPANVRVYQLKGDAFYRRSIF